MGIKEKNYWVFDVEGNGATPPEIIEIAMVEVMDFKLTGQQRRWLVRPQHPIDPSVTRIHGITDDDIADAPSINDIADEILQLMGDAPIIGHNVRVEVDAIGRAISRWKPKVAIDTLRLAKKIRPDLESYGLEKLGKQFGCSEKAAQLSKGKHHSALYDSILTALIFIDLLTSTPEWKWSDILNSADILYKPQMKLL